MRVAVVYDRKAGYRWGTSGAPCFPWYWDGTYFNSDARQALPAAYFEVLRASCSMMATCRWTVYTVTIPGFSTSLICGGIAGMVGQTSSYPLDIVRRRMQTSAIKGQHYHTITSTVVKIYTEEGIMAFYKGLSMNWVKGPIAVGISFATHDTIRDTLRKVICEDNDT